MVLIQTFYGKTLQVTVFSESEEALGRQMKTITSICGGIIFTHWKVKLPRCNHKAKQLDWMIIGLLLKDADKKPLKIATAITSSSFPSLGNPSVVYEESDESSAPRPVSINGTHAQAVTFTGNGTLAGIPVMDTGTAYLVTRSDGSIYTFGNGAIVSKTGNGILTYTFDAIGHYLIDTGHVIIKSTSGILASFSDKIGLYKDWYDISGNGMTTMWFWKG
jgi:hypothetical protein